MKRGFNLVLGLVFVVLFVGFVSSLTTASFSIGTLDTCDNANKIIMRMSSSTNAHGEIYSNTNYNIVLCSPVANEQACDYYCSGESTECDSIEDKNSCEAVYCNWKARNKIIGLSAETNAHAEGPSQYNYDVDICYGDLSCVYVNLDEENTCSQHTNGTYPIDVLSLSSFTNAHIGAFGYENYPIKVCCKEGGLIEPFCGDLICNGEDTYETCPSDCDEPRAYWAEYASATTGIEGEIKVRVDDEAVDVWLIYENEALPNTQISFEIYENDLLDANDAIRIGKNALIETTDLNGRAAVPWAITSEDIALAENGIFGTKNEPGEDYEFEFIAQDVPSGELITTISKASDIDSCLGIEYCSNYNDLTTCEQDSCNAATASVIANSPGGVEVVCDGVSTFCYCEWNETESECGPYVGYMANGREIGSCHYNEDSSDDCDDGLLSYSWQGIWAWAVDNIAQTTEPDNPDNYVEINSGETTVWYYDPNLKYLTCLDGSNTVVCPSQIQLPFFSAYNLVIAVIVIALIYFLILKNSKKKGKKKKIEKRK